MSYDDYCRRFQWALDMNADGAVTISDLWLLVKAIFLLPATIIASLLHSSDTLAIFFEIDCATGQGGGGAIFSSVAWYVLMVIVEAKATQRGSQLP